MQTEQCEEILALMQLQSDAAQVCLSTIATVTATLLGIFVAAYAAYIVFLTERTTDYRDKVVEHQIAIATQSRALTGTWGNMFLPPEFGETYKRISSKVGSAMIQQAFTDLLTAQTGTDPDSALNRALAETRTHDAWHGTHIAGRVYLWILAQGSKLISAQDSPSQSSRAFPIDASGSGFDHWRRDYIIISNTLTALQQMFGQTAREDLHQLFKDSYHSRANEFDQFAATSTSGVFDVIVNINKDLADIDKLSLIASPYQEKAQRHIGRILVLVLIAALLGIVLPIVLLSLSATIDATAAVVIATLSLLFTFLPFTQVVSDIRSAPRSNYLLERWIGPLRATLAKATLTNDSTGVPQGALAATDPFVDALNGSDASLFSKRIRDSIADYVKNANKYNEYVRRVAAAMTVKLRERAGQLHLLSAENVSAMGFTIETLSDDESFRLFIERIAEKANNDIIVQLVAPTYMRDELRIKGHDLNDHQAALLKSVFEEVRTELLIGDDVTHFRSARTQLLQSARSLDTLLSEQH